MFQITLRLTRERFDGINALDFCRRLRLPESSNVQFTDGIADHQAGARTAKAQVSEAFARAYFAPDETDSWATVSSRFLVPSDLVRACEGNNYAVTFSKEITAERVQEIYLAVRFAACRAQVAKLKARLDELQVDDENEEEDAD
jgi:hypothetical protein